MSLSVKLEKKLKHFTLQADFEMDDVMLAAFGPSGAGKTMLLKCIAGIERPDRGRIVLNDRVLFDSEKGIDLPPQRRKVGYLFQDHALFPTMTAAENLFIVMGRRDEEKVSELFLAYGLSGCENLKPDMLSGGQMQRVALLRILVSEPECILLDEPFSAVDEDAKKKMQEEMKELLKGFSGPSILVSHSRRDIHEMASSIISVKDGAYGRMEAFDEFFGIPESYEEAVSMGIEQLAELVWLDESRVYVPDWDMEIVVPASVDRNSTHVGMQFNKVFYLR